MENEVVLKRRYGIFVGNMQITGLCWEFAEDRFDDYILVWNKVETEKCGKKVVLYDLASYSKITGEKHFEYYNIYRFTYGKYGIILKKYKDMDITTKSFIKDSKLLQVGLINLKGNIVIPFGKYMSIERLEYECFKVKSSKGVGICTLYKEGYKELISPIYRKVIVKRDCVYLQKDNLKGVYFFANSKNTNLIFKELYRLNCPSVIIGEKLNGEKMVYNYFTGELVSNRAIKSLHELKGFKIEM